MNLNKAEKEIKSYRNRISVEEGYFKQFEDCSVVFAYSGEIYSAEDEYDMEAKLFLLKAGTELKVSFSHYAPYHEGEKAKRDIYNVLLQNKRHIFTFTFGDSINNSNARMGIFNHPGFGKVTLYARDRAIEKARWNHRPPNAYDILACLTAYDPGTFNDFCDEFGYDNDSITTQKVYFDVQKEFEEASKLFTSKQLELLHEIN